MKKNIKHYIAALSRLLEIQTSIMIFTATIVGTLFVYYTEGIFQWDLFLAMLGCGVALDAAATVFNHFYDYFKAHDKEGYLYTIHNPIVYYHLKPAFAFLVGIGVVGIAGILGLYLVFTIENGWVLLIAGVISTLIAILYSFGKKPIAYLPISEFVSGFFEGTVVIMAIYFINTGSFSVTSFWVSLPISLGIANIMLANNITDLEEDKVNKRITLPIMIGQKKGIYLLITTTTLMYVITIGLIIFQIIPMLMFLSLLFVPIVVKHLIGFTNNTTKAVGFPMILKNTLLFNISMILIYFLEIMIH